ncbi:MAG: 23S rRNA (pseudouridine(1915)-N(3))-methyltransferase RlmH [Pseudomonadales bacterium]|jgi:23S rRNA (pseudouridine1915-N3)-methyltransferase
MHNQLLCVGHKPPQWVLEGESQYLKRLRPALKVTLISPSSKSNSDQRKVQEAELIQAKLVKNAWVVALDETGSQYSSRELADKVTSWQRHGRPLAFVIGGADGLDKSFLAQADSALSLSKQTLPHALVRVFLAEALYRVQALQAGHPYHRD